MIRDCIETLAHRISEKDIEVVIREEDDLPEVRGDPEALQRMILNVLNNAVKYNSVGGRVTVELRRESSEIVLEVADSGLGIPPESLSRVFERFYRVDKARSRAEGGTGLGLAIVKHTAQIHGGQVDVESRIGRGSTFRIHLPVGRER